MSQYFVERCPRCGSGTFEHLESYAHCSECLYVEDFDQGLFPMSPSRLADYEKLLPPGALVELPATDQDQSTEVG